MTKPETPETWSTDPLENYVPTLLELRHAVARAVSAESQVEELLAASTREVVAAHNLERRAVIAESKLREAEADRDRLKEAATKLVLEYRSHSGVGTHERCFPGAGCQVPKCIDALEAALAPPEPKG